MLIERFVSPEQIEERDDTDLDFRVPQQKFRSVLHAAAAHDDTRMITMLLENGADPTVWLSQSVF
jgi:3-methyladenine DNA glycosylase/8-oxoguanine DNA glycosylase